MNESTFKKLLQFKGNNSEYIGLRIINNLLTVVTLGIYYPWARASNLKYLYKETEFQGSAFEFHGTGKEMFIGFLKVIGIIIVLYAIFFGCMLSQNVVLIILGVLLIYAFLFVLIPIAIHGSLKYRLSRSSWRGIHFGYRGNLKEFMGLYVGQLLLTLVTFGIYSSWMQCNVEKYVRSHSRLGNVELKFTGEGGDLFMVKLKGIFLIIITLGIYSFWYYKDLFDFHIKNTKIIQDGKEINLRSTLSGGDIFVLLFTNYFIIVFTFGICTGIAINRTMQTIFANVEFDNEIDVTKLVQTEEDYKNATGDDLSNMLDISIV